MSTLEPELLMEDCKPTKVEDCDGRDLIKLERVDDVLPKGDDDSEKLYRMLDVTKEEFASAGAQYLASNGIKPESEDRKPRELSTDELKRARKRPRSVPVVLVPTLAEVRRRKEWIEDVEEIKEDYKKLKMLKNKAPETSRNRIPNHYFKVDQATREVKVTRIFMSQTYGGNSQRTYPPIGAHFLAKHGMNDFMYINKKYQIEAPEIPGAPGLFFCTGDTHASDVSARRVLVSIKQGIWQYLGQYQMARSCTPSPFLTTEEWAAQPKMMRDTWAKVLASKDWGSDICARIRGRKEFGREPTNEEVDGLLNNGRYKLTTPQEVMAALDAGIERLTVWTLKCVGYDNDFQLQLSEKFPVWERQQTKKKVVRKPVQQGNGGSRGKKRKRADTPESEDTDGGEDEVADKEDD
ncbi:hypothetical protein M413DRAFT_26695 [Hebeloma cylindrosporum]|uniref:DUF6697 domain-containing protein n=1 Tax=Hebeloma cylindrosporum TaxID=76867 RepID=A0A0C3C1D9_HEBCY|nr:hypothetical protein M413DRAFT_26695 [Hebeloma cylindrosporum h7]